MQLIVDQVTMQCLVGDITRQPDLDAIVNSTGGNFDGEGGVAHKIDAETGPPPAAVCKPRAPIAPGEAGITGGFESR